MTIAYFKCKRGECRAEFETYFADSNPTKDEKHIACPVCHKQPGARRLTTAEVRRRYANLHRTQSIRGDNMCPIYEYKCTECGEVFDLIRPFSESKEDSTCPKCEATAKKIVSQNAEMKQNWSSWDALGR